MSLGIRLQIWLTALGKSYMSYWYTSPTYKYYKMWMDTFARHPDQTTAQIIKFVSTLPAPTAHLTAMIISSFTGTPLPPEMLSDIEFRRKLQQSPAEYIAEQAHKLGSSPVLAGSEEALGALLDGLIVMPLEDMLDRGIEDTHAFIRRVHGIQAGLELAGGAIALIAEISSAGQIKSLSYTLIAMFESMGMSRIGFRAIAPLFDIGVNEAQRRNYQKRYRPRRWKETELMQLYALRQMTESELRVELASLGFRDGDIAMAVRLAEQRVGVGDIFMAYNLHIIDSAEAVNRLHDKGYAPDDIQFLMALEDRKNSQVDLASISTIALEAYKKDLIGEASYRQMRLAARVPQSRIDLEVELATLTKQSAKADLKVSSIEKAYKLSILSQVEVDHYLLQNGVDDTARGILIATWDAERAPKHLTINATTITRAYRNDIFTRTQALDRLKSVGWSGEDAALLLELADARSGGSVKQLSESAVISAYTDGLLSRAEALQRLHGLGLSDADAILVVRVSELKPAKGQKTLTEAQIFKLAALGAWTAEDVIGYLTGYLGYDDNTAHWVYIAETTKIARVRTKSAPRAPKVV